jgi:hypothetical protein
MEALFAQIYMNLHRFTSIYVYGCQEIVKMMDQMSKTGGQINKYPSMMGASATEAPQFAQPHQSFYVYWFGTRDRQPV